MEDTLGDLFDESADPRGPIEFQGHTVYRWAVIPLHCSEILAIRHLRSSRGKHALVVGSERSKAELHVRGFAGKGFAIWSQDLRREPVSVRSKEDCTIVIWNEWIHRGSRGGLTGDSGMIIEHPDPNTWILHCRDAFGGNDFSDLVVEARVSMAT